MLTLSNVPGKCNARYFKYRIFWNHVILLLFPGEILCLKLTVDKEGAKFAWKYNGQDGGGGTKNFPAKSTDTFF